MARVSTSLNRVQASDRYQARVDTELALLAGGITDLARVISSLSEEQKEMPYEQIRKAYTFPFELRPYQVERIEQHAHSDLAGFYWEPGCVDSETEYLTPTGWRRIADYTGGPVAQFFPDTGAAEFVEPVRFIKAPCESMIRIKTKCGIDQLLSPEHRVLAYSGRGHKPVVVSAEEVLTAHDEYHVGAPARLGSTTFRTVGIEATFSVRGGPGMPISVEEARLQVAVVSRGKLLGDRDKCRVRLFKVRQVSRLQALLAAACVPFETHEAPNYTEFTFTPPVPTTSFNKRFWKASSAQLSAMAEELRFWGHDGGLGRGARFTSTHKADADFVQYVWTASGRVARIVPATRRPGSTGATVHRVIERAEGKGPAGLRLYLRSQNKRTVWREPSTDGFKYCFEVPSGFLTLRRNGCVFTTGNSGKTAGLTHWALYRSMQGAADQWVGLMPPILLDQWEAWLRSIADRDSGVPLSVSLYRGTPAQRKKVDLGRDFVLMSYAIFKNDYERLVDYFDGRDVGLFCDEAHAVKNIKSQTHKAVKHFSEGRPLALLTGTPLTKPDDAYAYMRLLAPGLYRNKRHFEKLHIEEVDEYGKVLKWINLDLMSENLKVNTSRVIRREVRSELPDVIYTPVSYSLDAEHMKLYHRIAEEQLAAFDGLGVIPTVSMQRVRAALQQVVVNYAEFAGDESLRPAAFDLIDTVMEELGDDGKLVVVANFIRTNRLLQKYLSKYGGVAIYGEVSPKEKSAAIDKFIRDASCRVMQIQPQSAGFGVDGLQAVCSDMLFLEAPSVPPPFHQTVARLDRDGQTRPVNCRVAIASGTVQVRMFKQLLNNDETVNSIQGGYQDLREAIFGQ